MDFHSMFEEMHAAMAEMMEVRRTMMDRMFGSFGMPMFPSFPSLLEDFDRDFSRDFAFPRIPRQIREIAVPQTTEAASAPANTQQQATQPTPQPQPAQPTAQTGSQVATTGKAQQLEQRKQGLGLDSSVMYSSSQYYNSADPSKNYSRYTTTQAGPAGVLESRTAVRDNREGLERVEVRRQLGDRFTHVTRKRRLDTGEESVEKIANNLKNEELSRFEEEWEKLAKEHLPMYRSEGVSEAPVPQLGSSQGAPEVQRKVGEVGNIPVGNVPTQTQAQVAQQPTPMHQDL